MKFMKMVFVLCFIILPNVYGVSANCMPFKIGFEFQTCGGLCTWAKNNYNFQKRPIFYVEQDKKKIWHLEIDGTGLEFVTEPFSYKEKALLRVALEQITKVIELIKRNSGTLTIGSLFDNLRALEFQVISEEFLDQIRKQEIKHVDIISLTPQMTVQHPLKYTVDLCYSLFGDDEDYLFEKLLGTLPFKQRTDNGYFFRSAIGGLTFLQAHTMVMMASQSLEDDNEQLDNIIQCIDTQMDAKHFVPFMSRRPFSHLLKEIKDQLSIGYLVDPISSLFLSQLSYTEIFYATEKAVFLRELLSNFYRASYGEQFFAKTGRPLDLRGLFPHCLLPEESISRLLSNGFITTVMLRNIPAFSRIFPSNYHELVVHSTEFPYGEVKIVRTNSIIDGEDRIKIVLENRDDQNLDLLSPPFPLDKNDAMGRYKEVMGTETFGGAVVEFRGLKNISSSFLYLKHYNQVVENCWNFTGIDLGKLNPAQICLFLSSGNEAFLSFIMEHLEMNESQVFEVMKKIGLENTQIAEEHIPPEVIASISKKLVKTILLDIETKLDSGMFLSYANSKREEFVEEALRLFDYIGSIPDNSVAIDFICEYQSTSMRERR